MGDRFYEQQGLTITDVRERDFKLRQKELKKKIREQSPKLYTDQQLHEFMNVGDSI